MISRVISTVTALAVFLSATAGAGIPVFGGPVTEAVTEPVMVSQNQIVTDIQKENVSVQTGSYSSVELSADLAQPQENTYYLLVSAATGKTMTVEGNSDGNSVGICQMDVGNYRSQVWSLKKVTKTDDPTVYYRIINYHSGKALNIPANSTEEGKQIIQWDQGSGDNCIFSLTELSDGSYRISSRLNPTYSIKVKDNSSKKGAAVVQGTYGEGDNDGWKLVEIEESAILDNPGLQEPDSEAALEAYIQKFTYTDDKGVAQLSKCGGFWAQAEMVEMLIDAYEQLGGEKYKALMINHVDGFLFRHGTNWQGNDFNDDVMWATIMCARTYLLTGEEKYLDIAKNNFAIAYDRGISDDMGGGLWWKVFDEGETKSKNSCANGPAAVAACLLGEATGDTSYYEKARGLIDWQVSKMYVAEGEDAGKVYDSLDVNGKYNYWASTYNQGTFIGACTMLYQHYNEQKYFDYANAAANYSATKLGSGTEKYLNGEQDNADLIGFKGILARWLSYFAVNCNVDDYNDWMYRNAASAWTNRNSENIMWTQFGKPTEEKVEESTETLNENTDETIGEFAGWGCSTAVAWIMDCTGIDARQTKKQQQTETPGVTAGRIALQKVVEENRPLYEAGQGNNVNYAWKEFTDAYQAALTPAANVTAAELKALQGALEKASTGLSNAPGSVIEAESGTLKGGVDIVDAADCSGGKRIGDIGDGMNKTATYSVSAGRTGEYKISIYYCTSLDRQLNVVINGEEYPVSCKSNGSWEKPTTNPAVVTATLNKGENTIIFGGVGTNFAPNVDYFLFEKVITEEDAALDQAEDALEEVLAQYESIMEAGGNYTEESYQKFKAAYDAAEAALYGREDVSAEKLKELQNALTEAKEALEVRKPEDSKDNKEDDDKDDDNKDDGMKNDDMKDDDTKDNDNKNDDGDDSAIGGKENGNEEKDDKGDHEEYKDEELPEGVEATAREAEKNITSANTDNGDPEGSSFAGLQLKAVGKNKSVKLTWKKVKDAEGYIVYGAQCGKTLKKIKTLKGASKKSYTHKKLKKAKYYKYIVVAYKTIDGKKYILTSSKSAHAVTTGGKYASPTKVSVKSSKITLKKGGKKTIKASCKLPKNKKTRVHIAKFRYESTNPKVVTVNKKGVVKGKKKGTAYIYVYAQNGVCKKVKVTVKD